jgi:hypothetical protein
MPEQNLPPRERRYRRFFEIVDEVVEEIQEHIWRETGKPKRRVKGDQLQKLRVSVETLIRDSVAVTYQRQRVGEAMIHLKRNWYSSPACPSDLSHKVHIGRAYAGMLELGYLEVTKRGSYDRSESSDGRPRNRLTRYRATDLLIDKFTEREQEVLPVMVPPAIEHASLRISVWNQKKGREVFPVPDQEGEALLMDHNLDRINQVIAGSWYDLDISDDEMLALQGRLSADTDDPRPLALNRRSLHRVFNSRNLQTGGRFYGGWWQNIPKEYRRKLTVNGKRMVEIDYSNLHPAILYAQENAVPPSDCYRGIFTPDVEARGGGELRSTVKAAFNAMLNASKPLARSPRGIDPGKFGLKWRELSDAITAAHQPIAHHFYKGAGKRLQRIDSDVAERVMLDFIDQGIAILPVHDSFLVHEGHAERLELSMAEALRVVCGVETRLKLTEPDRGSGVIEIEEEADGFGPDTPQDVAELMAGLSGAERRLDAFRSIQRWGDT